MKWSFSILKICILTLLCIFVLSGQTPPNTYQFYTAAPNSTIPTNPAVIVVNGIQGGPTYYYWVVARYPIGNVLASSQGSAGRNAPLTLNMTNYIQVFWTAAPGATGYDVIRLTTPTFNPSCTNCLVASNTTSTFINDNSQSISSYNLTGIVNAAQASMYLDNQNFSTPRLIISALQPTTFACGTNVTCPGGGGTVGPGTPNVIPEFTSTTTIGNSSITDSGATVSTTEPFAAPSISTGTAPPTCTPGTAGCIAIKEGTVPTVCTAIGVQCLYADGTAHQLFLSVNSGSYFPITASIASGTTAMGTSAIGAAVGGVATCGTVITVSATGVTTGDTVVASANVNPSIVSGYSSGITLYVYPTANNVNFAQCNPTAGPLTPSAMSVNWIVNRAL